VKSYGLDEDILHEKKANSYDQNGGTFISVPILEDEIWKLPVICLHILTSSILRVMRQYIYH